MRLRVVRMPMNQGDSASTSPRGRRLLYLCHKKKTLSNVDQCRKNMGTFKHAT
jgi:hypothetical protein